MNLCCWRKVIDANVSMATASTHLASQSQQPRLRRPPQEMTAEEKARADVADVRCLNLCVEVLEKVNGVCASFILWE